MSKSIYIDNINNIYVSQTSEGSIEVSLKADESSVIIKVQSLAALKELSEKMVILNSIFFNSADSE